MHSLQLFDDFDENISIKTDNDYAENYDKWRKKEELNKLRTKYGEEFQGNSDVSSSDDDEEEINSEFEKEFFKTLSFLKKKDPQIYNENITFFENISETTVKKTSKDKVKPMFLKDYERKIIVENGGQFSDEDENEPKLRSLTYTEEQEQLKRNLKTALQTVTEEDEDDAKWGGLFKERLKTEEEKIKEEEEYKLWLAGQKEHLNDTTVEDALKPLKEYWSSPNLDDGEKFLRDYILNKRFLDTEGKDYIPTYEEIIHDSDKGLSEDESTINKQEEFEHKYNFRFEEPDQEFIKRYPRTMENSLRKKDDKRKMKRAEVRERKKKEKQQKMEEIKLLKALKRKEIEEKLEMLKEITGNSDAGFNPEDIEGDFNPEEYDKRMQSLFNNEFYSGPEGDQKPQFPEIDRKMDLEIENWDRWDGEEQDNEDEQKNQDDLNDEHCEENENFNMDCDYDKTKAKQKKLIENTKSKRKRKRKSKFAKVISLPKPVFNPEDKTFTEYLDEYYKLDCEDIIGDLPCRFKYREVIPNGFGLTTEEILLANDKELNRWCSLKKAVQYRPEHVERYDQIVYERKGKNESLKRKILPSLYADINEDNKEEIKFVKSGRNNKQSNKNNSPERQSLENKTNKKKRKIFKLSCGSKNTEDFEEVHIQKETTENAISKKKKKKRKQKLCSTSKDEIEQNNQPKKLKPSKMVHSQENVIDISDVRLAAFGLDPKKFRNKVKYVNKMKH